MPHPADPDARAALLELLGSTWSYLPSAIARAERWGADWYALTTPFVRYEDGRAIAMIGVVELPLRIAGRDVVVAGLHGACTRPAHRGRGHLRALLEDALRFADTFSSTTLLWTDAPALYERFGFRPAVEEGTRVQLDVVASKERPRRLDLDRPDDLALLWRGLEQRAPVSSRLASRDRGALFMLDLALHGALAPALVHVPALDAIVCVETSRDTLCIHDVIAPRIPPLREITSHLGISARTIELGVTPELLWDGPRTHARSSTTEVLMVRGPFAPEPPFALSPLARC